MTPGARGSAEAGFHRGEPGGGVSFRKTLQLLASPANEKGLLEISRRPCVFTFVNGIELSWCGCGFGFGCRSVVHAAFEGQLLQITDFLHTNTDQVLAIKGASQKFF